MKTSHSLLSLLMLATPAVVAFASGCSNPTDDAATADDNEVVGEKSIELAAARSFFKTRSEPHAPTAFEVGFADAPGAPLEGLQTIAVTYHDDRTLQVSDAVVVHVPAALAHKKVISFAPSFGGQPTQRSYATLTNPEGTWRRIPVTGGGSYPLSSECYGFAVGEDWGNAKQEIYNASKVSGIIFGFTTATAADLAANKDIPWQDGLGNEGNEPFRTAEWFDGVTNKPFRDLQTEWVRVPSGKKLVFKVKYDEFWGTCGTENDTAPRSSNVFTKPYLF